MTRAGLDRLLRILGFRRGAYRAVFLSHDGHVVLRDLAPFCRAAAPCRTPQEEGRREVWLRIRRFLDLGDEDLVKIYGGLPLPAYLPVSAELEE